MESKATLDPPSSSPRRNRLLVCPAILTPCISNRFYSRSPCPATLTRLQKNHFVASISPGLDSEVASTLTGIALLIVTLRLSLPVALVYMVLFASWCAK